MKDKREILEVIENVLDKLEQENECMSNQDIDFSIRGGNLIISLSITDGKPKKNRNQTLILIREGLENEGYVVTPSGNLLVHLKPTLKA